MSTSASNFDENLLDIDCERVVGEIAEALRETVFKRFLRKGLVLGLSGGIDSSVCAALAARALGPERVLGLLMPERESASCHEAQELATVLAECLGIESITEDISSTLDAAGCYSRRDEALRSVLPEYGPGWKCKIVLPSVVNDDRYRFFSVVARDPDGNMVTKRLKPAAYLGVVAATNFKQRVRKMMEYFHADRLHRAVIGTPNRLEYDQGFFVKGGDGQADIKPIAHLYKTQVYALAAHFELPAIIQGQRPTTDTYSLPQTQEEFYFSLPYEKMDLCLWAFDHQIPAAKIGEVLDLTPEQVTRVFRDIEGKRKNAEYLHSAPIILESAFT